MLFFIALRKTLQPCFSPNFTDRFDRFLEELLTFFSGKPSYHPGHLPGSIFLHLQDLQASGEPQLPWTKLPGVIGPIGVLVSRMGDPWGSHAGVFSPPKMTIFPGDDLEICGMTLEIGGQK